MNDFDAKVESYLLGELTGSEVAEFEAALQTDAALSKSVAEHRELMQRLDALRLRNKVKSALAQPEAAAEKAGPGLSRRSWLIAVALILLCAAGWVYYRWIEYSRLQLIDKEQNMTPADPAQPILKELPAPIQSEPQAAKPAEKPPENRAQLLAMEFQAKPSSSFLRAAAGDDNDVRQKDQIQLAAEAYENKNYRLVLDHLAKMVIAEQDEEALFLQANAWFQLGQFAAAARNFNELTRSFQFKHEARWNFLLCQLALGNTGQVKTLLSAMTADADFPFHARALKLQRKLNF